MVNFLTWLSIILGGFLLGGVMFCRIIPRITVKKDVCELNSDRNPGAFNVFSSCGVFLGLVCLLLDMLKGFLPVFLGTVFLDSENLLFAAVIAMPVLGHALGVFNHFHGGKCISTSFGVVIGLMPLTWVGWILAGTYILFSVVLKINPHRRRSIFAFIVFGVLSCIILIIGERYSLAAGCLLLSAIAVVKHLKRFSPEEAIAQEPAAETEEPVTETEV